MNLPFDRDTLAQILADRGMRDLQERVAKAIRGLRNAEPIALRFLECIFDVIPAERGAVLFDRAPVVFRPAPFNLDLKGASSHLCVPGVIYVDSSKSGAFSSADSLKKGKIEAAEGGTIFLDEIGELKKSVQAVLLRVLQERTFQRVGGTQTLRANVRVLAATNRDLEAWVNQGEFRGDLYYRLNVIQCRTPSLRQISGRYSAAERSLHREVSLLRSFQREKCRCRPSSSGFFRTSFGNVRTCPIENVRFRLFPRLPLSLTS